MYTYFVRAKVVSIFKLKNYLRSKNPPIAFASFFWVERENKGILDLCFK